jgi:murein DD-endopeptidase MepM/ murein hydrolase activator NlpD
MSRAVVLLALAGALVLFALVPGTALAVSSPSPGPSSPPAATPAPTPAATPGATTPPAGPPAPAPAASSPAGPAPPTPNCPASPPSPAATPTPLPGSVAALCAQQQLLEQVREKLGANIATGLSTQTQLTQSLQQNQQEQQTLASAIVENHKQVARLDDEIASRQAKIEALQARIATERGQLALLARSIYYQPNNLLQRILQAGGLRKMLEQMGALTSAADRAQQLQHSLKQDLQTLDDAQQKENADRQAVAQLVAKQASDLQSLQKLQSDQQALTTALAQKITQTQGELGSVKNQQAALAQKITEELEAEQDQIIAAANQEVWNQVVLWEQANPVAGSVPSPGHSAKYKFAWPEANAVITQGFGPTDLWFEPALGGFAHFHTGIDIAAPQGTEIHAADDGVVALVGGGTTGYGNYVVIAHAGGLTTLYGHMLQPLVKQGDHVVQGQVIGLEGSTGNSTGPHVHFEVRVNGQPVDPTPYLPPGGPSNFRG